jgi:arylformamidase
MCDGPTGNGVTGWMGWPRLPAPDLRPVLGDWVDLTYPLSPDVPRHIGSHAAPTFTRVTEMPTQPLNISRMEMVVHVGTHVDAPRHFLLDGPAMEAVPLDRLMGPGVVARLDQPPDGVIEAGDLARATPRIEPGDIVAIATGWAERWGTPAWDHQPSLSLAAAQWLVEQRVKLLAVDTPTPDLPLDRRPPDFAWPIHHLLLGHGTLIAEQLANLRALSGQRVEFLFAPMPIVGSDGSPARVLARPVAA